jgi:ribonuclease P protein component
LTCPATAPTLLRLDGRKGETLHEADVSAESAPSEEDSRLPRANEERGRAQDAQAPPGQGTQTADRLTGRFPRSERLTRRAEIQTLFQQGKRIERPALIVLWRESEAPRRAAFAVTRSLRGSVRRNRARRRLREAFRVARVAAPERVDVVVIAKRGALDEPLPALTAQLTDALGAIRASA